MSETPTHRLVKTPKINSRYLSDYMVASERARRTIIRDCKYRKIARAIQHERAKAFISNSLRSGSLSAKTLREEGGRLLEMMADTDFERDTLDINGDFLVAYGEVFSMESFPKTAEVTAYPVNFSINLNGVDFNPDLRFGTQRITRTNRLRTGFGTVRYAKTNLSISRRGPINPPPSSAVEN